MQEEPLDPGSEGPTGSPTRPPITKLPRWVVRLVVFLVVVAMVVGVYYAFIYVPTLPIPAGTVVHLEGYQAVEWHFTVTHCCANLTGAWSADHPVGWWIGTWTLLGSHNPGGCTPQVPGGPATGTFPGTLFGRDLTAGEYLLGITCGSQPSVTVMFTQTVQVSYGG